MTEKLKSFLSFNGSKITLISNDRTVYFDENHLLSLKIKAKQRKKKKKIPSFYDSLK
jgi:hypothetical protein